MRKQTTHGYNLEDVIAVLNLSAAIGITHLISTVPMMTGDAGMRLTFLYFMPIEAKQSRQLFSLDRFLCFW